MGSAIEFFCVPRDSDMQRPSDFGGPSEADYDEFQRWLDGDLQEAERLARLEAANAELQIHAAHAALDAAELCCEEWPTL